MWIEDFTGSPVGGNPHANAGDTGSIPVLERYHMPQRNWARVPPLPSPSAATTETHAPGAPALQQEKPLQWAAHTLQLQSSLHSCN